MADQQKHLLLVEDETPLRQAVAEQLGDRGYRVEQADSGEAAIAKLADFAFDIIVTDLRLPGLDGSAAGGAAGCRDPPHLAGGGPRLWAGAERGCAAQTGRPGPCYNTA